jgi:hypothetical protein
MDVVGGADVPFDPGLLGGLLADDVQVDGHRIEGVADVFGPGCAGDVEAQLIDEIFGYPVV